MAHTVVPSSSAPNSSSMNLFRTSAATSTILGLTFKAAEIEQTHLRLIRSFKNVMLFKIKTTMQPSGLTPRDKNDFIWIYAICTIKQQSLRLKASKEIPGLTQELIDNKLESLSGSENGCSMFSEMKHHFLSFKKHKYLENLEHFQNLAKIQAPKFMVIACADSRVCPSNILGFQPGEAFVVRNVANLVPPFEDGPSETNAALEFAVNSLEVENILVIGHSCCGGIRALMSMQDEVNSSTFIGSWVTVGKHAKLSTKAAASKLSFDEQCRHCEKESINRSLLNLLGYPWIEERVIRGLLSIHGGYYDFINCTFEKWTLDYRGSTLTDESSRYSLRNREFWH